MRARTRIIALISVVIAATVAAPVAVADKVGGGPDESPAQAQPIAQNQVVSGAFQGSKDYYDYYSYKAKAGQTLKFTLTDTTTSCSGSRDPYQDGCPVYGWTADSGGGEIGGSGSGAGGNTAVGHNAAYSNKATWTWTFSQAGTYYIGLQDDAGPGIPAGTPTYTIELTSASTTKTHHRTISLSVKRGASSLIFHGQLGETTGFRPCTAHQPVEIQRKSSTSWLTIAHTTTGAAQPSGPANFRVSTKEKPGKYRALAPPTTAGSGNTCDKAVSKSVAVEVVEHHRQAVLQSVSQGGSHADLVGYVKATDGFARCVKRVPVLAQRRAGSRWTKVGQGQTGSPNTQGQAPFNISVPLRSGSYRVVVPPHNADALDACLKTVSNTKSGPAGH